MADDAAPPLDPTANVDAIRQGVHDLLYNHPVLGGVLRLAHAVGAVRDPAALDTAAAPVAAAAAPVAARALADDLPPVKDIALPVAKPIALPLDPSADESLATPSSLTKPKSLAKPRALAGGRR